MRSQTALQKWAVSVINNYTPTEIHINKNLEEYLITDLVRIPTSEGNISPILDYGAVNIGDSTVAEIAAEVRLLQSNIVKCGVTLKKILRDCGYATDPIFLKHVIEVMRAHGYPNINDESAVDLSNREFLRALLWAPARLQTPGADISNDVLDAGITEALRAQPSRTETPAGRTQFQGTTVK